MANSYWYAKKVDSKVWNNQESFNENEDIPTLKHFLMKLYVSDEIYSKDFEKRIHKLLKKIDIIIRKDFDENIITEHENNILKTLTGFTFKHYSNIYNNPKNKIQKESMIQEAVVATIEGIKKTYSNNIRTKNKQEQIKKENKILKELKFPLKLKFNGKTYKFKDRKDFDQNVYYTENYELIAQLSEKKDTVPNLLLSEVI